MKRQAVIVLAAAGLAGGGGFLAGRMTVQDQDSSAVQRGLSSETAATDSGATVPAGVASTDRAEVRAAVVSDTSALAPISKEEFLKATEDLSIFSGFRVSSLRQMVNLQERLLKQDVRPILESIASARGKSADAAWFLAMGAYTEQDPAGALEFALKLPKEQERSMALHQAISALMEKDPDGTLTRIKAIEDPLVRKQASAAAHQAMAMKDPARAFEMMLSDGKPGDDFDGAWGVFYSWSRKDPKAAAVALEKVKDDRARVQFASSLAAQWASTDPEAAWEWVQTTKFPNSDGHDPRAGVLSIWANTDPKRAIQMAEAISDEEVRRRSLASIISSWTRVAPDEAIAWATTIADTSTRAEILSNMAGDHEADPEKIVGLLTEYMPAGEHYNQSMRRVISRWAYKDPAAAAAALSELPGNHETLGISEVAREWARKDSAAAFRWACALPESAGRTSALKSYIGEIAKTNLPQARADLQRVPPADYKAAVRAFAQGWAEKDPAAAAGWVTSLPQEETRRSAIEMIANRWASSSPGRAGVWAVSLPESDREAALAAVTSQWSRKDLAATAEWLNQIPATKSRDRAVESLSQSLVSDDPEAALLWAGSITDEKHRMRLYERHARAWMRVDAAAARKWIEASPLSAETKTGLLKQ